MLQKNAFQDSLTTRCYRLGVVALNWLCDDSVSNTDSVLDITVLQICIRSTSDGLSISSRLFSGSKNKKGESVLFYNNVYNNLAIHALSEKDKLLIIYLKLL